MREDKIEYLDRRLAAVNAGRDRRSDVEHRARWPRRLGSVHAAMLVWRPDERSTAM
jgi:hypothetical protein